MRGPSAFARITVAGVHEQINAYRIKTQVLFAILTTIPGLFDQCFCFFARCEFSTLANTSLFIENVPLGFIFFQVLYISFQSKLI